MAKTDPEAEENTPLLVHHQLLLPGQSHTLSQRRLLIIFPALALIQFISFLDQTAISTSLPAVASALDIGASISLVGASFLITSTSIQLINGRLSDIFGRKASLITALSIMGIGNLWSGFAKSPVEMFVARAFTGFGAGAINALVQIAIADITTLEQRGYYFGMVGMATALGNGLGPLVGGALTQTVGWRWSFWFVCPLCVLAVGYLVSVWPLSSSSFKNTNDNSVLRKLRLVDWSGACASLFGIALCLIPISQCGSTMSWASPAAIGMLAAGLTLLAVFLIIEFRFAKLPILPIQLFRYNYSTNILIGVNVFIGWIYWGNLFVLPLYLQNVRGASPAQAGVLILPMVVAHGLTSALTGIIISLLGRYKPIIVTGALCWALAAFAKLYYHPETPIWQIVVVGIFDGIGVGCSLQPVMVGILAGSDSEDRAVLTGLRNFVRDIGGATGTTISGAILSNILSTQLRSRFDDNLVQKLISSAFALNDLNLSLEEKNVVTQTYMNGLHAVFVSFACLIALHLCACVCLCDYGLKRGTIQLKQQQQQQQQKLIRGEGEEVGQYSSVERAS